MAPDSEGHDETTGGEAGGPEASRSDGGDVTDEQAEIEQLRAEVAELRAAEAAQAAEAGGDTGRRRSAAGRSGRWALSLLLVVLVSVLAIVAVVARYARSQLLDTDRYVETVSPLAENPDVQDAIATQVTNEIFTRLDVEQVTEDALARLTELGAPQVISGLAVPISDQVESFTREEVDKALATPEFANLWDQANRRAHQAVVAVLTGEDRDAVSVEDGAVTVDLGTIVARVKQRLVDRGFGLASNIPEVSSTFTLVESDRLSQAQRGVRLLDSVATWLPFVIVGLAAVAILVAPNRRRGLVAVAVGVALSMVLLAVALALARAWYLDHATGDVLSPDAAVSVARTLLSPLRTAMRAVLALGLVVALAGFLAGPSAPARGVRSIASRAQAGARGRIEGEREPTPVEAWIGAHKMVLRLAIVAFGVLVFAFWTYPSGAVVLSIALLVLVGLALVEVFGWTRTPASPSTPAPG